MNVVRAALFDMDGVLLDSVDLHRETFIRFLAPMGIELSKERFDNDLFGYQGPDIIKKLFGDEYSLEERKRMSRKLDAIFHQLAREKTVPVRGIKEFIASLKKSGIPMALGTSGSPENVETVLEVLNLNGTFSAILTEIDVANGKPHPAIYQMAAQRLEVPIGECVVFEDMPIGITAAKRAGAFCVALTTTTDSSRLEMADAIIPDFLSLRWEDIQKLLT